MTTPAAHPLEMLTGDEIKAAVKILRASGRVPEGALFAHIVLHEPHKDEIAKWSPGNPVERRVRAVIVPGPGMVLNELWGYNDPAAIERDIALHKGLRSEDVAEAALFMLTRPPNVAIRDLVMLPQNQDL